MCKPYLVKLGCRFLGVAVSLLLLLVGAVGVGAYVMWQALHTPYEIQPARTFSVTPGDSFTAVAHRLQSEEIIFADAQASALARFNIHLHALKLYARMTQQSGQIKTGEFQISGSMSPVDVLQTLINGRNIQYQFTIIEGWTFKQLHAALTRDDSQLIVTTKNMSPEEIMAAIGYPDIHPEGQFLPDTYYFPRGTSDVEFLRRSYLAMQDFLLKVWPERQPGLPLKTPYDAQILASIVEKETGVAVERSQIAGVFISRLRKNMRLQTDPTVIYGLGDTFDGNIRRRHLRQDNRYNTYTRHGLTPTPIALPGRAAIEAVLHPQDTEALYFVSRGDGTHQFSRTLDEHEAAVDRYQRKKRSSQ